MLDKAIRRFDRYQQRHPALAFPVAVVKKLGDDGAGEQASLIAFRAFFSMFPLLLVFVTVLGYALQGNPELQDRVLGSALSSFPVIGPQLQSDIHSLRGSGIALAIGAVGTLYGGLGVGAALESALDTVWNVPRRDRPGFPRRQLRALGFLAGFGVGILATTVLAGYAAGSVAGGLAGRAAALVVSGIVNLLVFSAAFRVLTAAPVRVADVRVGALLATIGWTVLQLGGGWFVSRQLQGANAVYGYFAVVIALLAWLQLAANVLLAAAEVDVVRTRRLWPRSLVAAPPNERDEVVYRLLARTEERIQGEHVSVGFDRGAANAAAHRSHTSV